MRRLLLFGLAWGAGLASGCGNGAGKPYDPSAAVSSSGGQITVAGDSPFLKHLEVGPVGNDHAGVQQLRVVGQIVAMADNSDELTGARISWSELSPELSKSLGLQLGTGKTVFDGEAYGMADLPAEYARQLARGDSIAVSRYGLQKYETAARVVFVRESPGAGGQMRVVFHMPTGEAWYPGNNCDVAFPMLRSRPVSVPATALLHEGAQEYLLQETGHGAFKPRKISILDSSAQSALVIGDIKPGDRVLSRGAILLKPFLHQLLSVQARGDSQEKAP